MVTRKLRRELSDQEPLAAQPVPPQQQSARLRAVRDAGKPGLVERPVVVGAGSIGLPPLLQLHLTASRARRILNEYSLTHFWVVRLPVQRLADRIRRHVIEKYVRPAREAAQSTFEVRAGDVHRALGLNNQVPAVCGAIGADKSLEIFGASRARRSGPCPSTTTEWVFELKPDELRHDPSTETTIPAVWERGFFRPLKVPLLSEGEHVTLILRGGEKPASAGGRFAAFAGTLSQEEAQRMKQEISREFGRIEGEW